MCFPAYIINPNKHSLLAVLVVIVFGPHYYLSPLCDSKYQPDTAEVANAGNGSAGGQGTNGQGFRAAPDHERNRRVSLFWKVRNCSIECDILHIRIVLGMAGWQSQRGGITRSGGGRWWMVVHLELPSET